jgi:hypothetical protein
MGGGALQGCTSRKSEEEAGFEIKVLHTIKAALRA